MQDAGPIPGAELDHIVVAAETLEAGLDHVESCLGIRVPAGGTHPVMATHNRLIRLGVAEFLEIIAPDPAAGPPSRPRWFGLDRPPAPPRLLHWVVRVPEMALALPVLPPESGPAIEATRGDLRWQLTVPEDGSLPFGGVLPSVIQWPPGDLPPLQMPGGGLTLRRLILHHPGAVGIAPHLAALIDDPRVELREGPLVRMEARIATPDGVRALI